VAFKAGACLAALAGLLLAWWSRLQKKRPETAAPSLS
jgi:hypothetical protein